MENAKTEDFSFYDLFVPLTTKKVIVFIFFLGFAVFFNMLFNGFIWDDKTYIVFNNDIHKFNLVGLFKENLFNAGGQYRLIPAIYFSLLFALFKNTTFFYHILQLGLHICNATLIFIFLKNYLNRKLAFVLSLIFLVHPIQVESVSYIASTGNPLFFLFGIIAFILCMKTSLNLKRLFSISLLLLLSFLTKESGFIFVFIILLYRFLFAKKNIIILIIPISISVIFYSIIRFGIGGVYFNRPDIIPITRLSLPERLINLPEIFFYYLKTAFFPIKLMIDQQWTISQVNFQNFYLPMLVDIVFLLLVGIFGMVIYKRNKKSFKIFLFFFLWFIFGIILYLQVFALDGTVADRWFYFPFVGLLGILGIGIQSIVIPRQFKPLFYITAIIIIALLSVRTIVRNTNWSNPISLYTHDLQNEDNYDIENNLGVEYSSVQNYSEAISHLRKSISLFPHEGNLYDLAAVYRNTNNQQLALFYYLKAYHAKNYMLTKHKHFWVTYLQPAYLLFLNDKVEEAREIIKNGLQDYPDSGDLWSSLALCEYKLHNQKDAVIAIEKARTLSPTDQNIYLYTQITNKQPIIMRLENNNSIEVN